MVMYVNSTLRCTRMTERDSQIVEGERGTDRQTETDRQTNRKADRHTGEGKERHRRRQTQRVEGEGREYEMIAFMSTTSLFRGGLRERLSDNFYKRPHRAREGISRRVCQSASKRSRLSGNRTQVFLARTCTLCRLS